MQERRRYTNKELSELKQGEAIACKMGRQWCKCIVTWVDREFEGNHVTLVHVQRLGLTSAKTPYATVPKYPSEIHHVTADLEPLTSNVYADWLEEHEFHEAAKALRQAFPIIVLGNPGDDDSA